MTPPPALPAAEPIGAAVPVDSKINRDLLSVMDGVSPGYFLLLGATILGVTAAAITWIYQIYIGLGIAGYTRCSGACTSSPSCSGSASRTPAR
jgi:hypothetical protein